MVLRKICIMKLTAMMLLLALFHPLGGKGATLAFRHFATNGGHLPSEMKCVLRDRMGLMWIGTTSGLYRYDGYRVRTFLNSEGRIGKLPEGDIETLQEDGDGNIWVGHLQDYEVYEYKSRRFVPDSVMLKRLGIPSRNLDGLFTDETGDLWVSADWAVHHFQFSSRSVARFRHPTFDGVASLATGAGKVYIVDRNGNIFQLNKDKWMSVVPPKGAGQVNRVYADRQGRLWAFSAMDNRLFRLGKKGWQEIRLSIEGGSSHIRQLKDDGEGTLWVVTDHHGLLAYDMPADRQRSDIETCGVEDNVQQLYIDRQNVMYVCNQTEGLSYYHSSFRKFSNHQTQQTKNLSAVIEDHAGNVWMGTDGHDLLCMKPDGSITTMDIPGHIVITLMEDREGRLWIGTYLNGLLCVDKGKVTHYTKENSGLSDNSIYSLCQDKAGYIWIGSLWGILQRFNPDSGEWKDGSPGTPVYQAYCMYYDDDNNLNVGGMGGLTRINTGSGHRMTFRGNRRGTQQLLNPNHISTLFRDHRGLLWIGHGHGISIWDERADTLYYLSMANGLCDNIIRGMVEDGKGCLWVTTSNGCALVTVAQTGETGQYRFFCNNYSASDGLQGSNFSRNGICLLSDGRMFLGTNNGYSIADTDLIYEEREQPNVVLAECTLKGNELAVGDRLTIRYDETPLELQFASTNIEVMRQVQYAWKLEGVTPGWQETKEGHLTLAVLRPGSYRLLVKAADGNGQWSGEKTVLLLTVSPPWWSSWTAYACYALLLGAMACLLWRHMRKQQRRKMEDEQTRLRHKQQVRLAEMKLQFFTNVSHDFRTPLTLILTPLQLLAEEVKGEKQLRQINGIRKNAERLLALVNQLLDFRKLDAGGETLHPQPGHLMSVVREATAAFETYASERHIDFAVTGNANDPLQMLDSDKIGKVMVNLLANAFKYTPDGGKIAVKVNYDDGQTTVGIYDTGTGIADKDKPHVFDRFYQTEQAKEKTGSGIGLHIAKEYVEMHHGTISVADNHPQGCGFTFSIPYVAVTALKDAAAADGHEQTEPSSAVTEAPGGERTRIMVVEDNQELLEFLKDSLSEDYGVLTAENGLQALEILKEEDVDMVITDVMMPMMDGVELCRQIKSHIEWSHIPVIMLTALSTDEDRLNSLEQGADEYVTKPFNLSVLRLRILKILEWTRSSHRKFREEMVVEPSEITITPLDEQLVAKAVKIVEEHMSDSDFSVEVLSQAIGMSRVHLYKKLKSITGRGPSEFIRTIRMKRACQLLGRSQMQIAEIAYTVGYNTPKAFTQNFKAEYGMLPSDYVRQYNGADKGM